MLRIITPEPILQDPTPDTSDEGLGPDEFEIVLGRRQIASLMFVALVLIAICSSVAYIAGRAQGQQGREASPPSASASKPPQVVEQAPAASAPPPVTQAVATAPAPAPVPPPAVIPPTVVQPTVVPPIPKLDVSRPAPILPPPSRPSIVRLPIPTDPAPRGSGPADEIEASMFAEPIPGARYIQVGSVDRGVAVILTEGLRTRGFNGFIAPGQKEGVYRVLVGPLRTNAEYQRAKDAVDRMGVSTFTRQFEK